MEKHLKFPHNAIKWAWVMYAMESLLNEPLRVKWKTATVENLCFNVATTSMLLYKKYINCPF